MDYHGIHNPQKARQLLLFEDISKDGIGMTDIDGLIEYKNRALILFEIKHGNKEVPIGQRLVLERMVNNAAATGKDAVAIVAEHSVEDPELPVFVRLCRVREIYWGSEKRWRKPHKELTAGEAADTIINMAKMKGVVSWRKA